MFAPSLQRFLAQQFAAPRGWIGRRLIGPWLNRIAGAMNRLVLEQLQVRPGERILEIGFGGGGLIVSILAVPDTQAVGVDISEAMLKRARRRFRREVARQRLRLIHASVESLPLPDGAADKASSVNNLYFWSDPAAGMAELARVIRPGGTLAVAFEPPEELRKWPGHRFGFRLFEVGEVRALMEQVGFGSIEESWGTGRKPDRFCCLTGTRNGAERGA